MNRYKTIHYSVLYRRTCTALKSHSSSQPRSPNPGVPLAHTTTTMNRLTRLFHLTSLSPQAAEAENLARTILTNSSLLDTLQSPPSRDLRRIGLAVLRLLDKTGAGRWDESDDPLKPGPHQGPGAKIRKRRRRRRRRQRRMRQDVQKRFPAQGPNITSGGFNLTMLKNDLEDITSTLSYLQSRRPTFNDSDFYVRFTAESGRFQASLHKALDMVRVAEGRQWEDLEGRQGTRQRRRLR